MRGSAAEIIDAVRREQHAKDRADLETAKALLARAHAMLEGRSSLLAREIEDFLWPSERPTDHCEHGYLRGTCGLGCPLATQRHGVGEP